MNNVIKVKQAAEILGVTTATVYDIVESGKLAHYRIGKGRGTLRFRREDVQDYLDSCYHEARSPDAPERPKSRRSIKSLRGLKFFGHCLRDAQPS